MELSGGNTGVVVVNLIIWTGIFLWLLRLSRRVKMMEESTEKEP
ncbi:MAG TPA: CcmD family protein [Thermoanaerobaculia bacterium]|nr:CcmD family protein [Thermoanaerobaculia bacterium]